MPKGIEDIDARYAALRFALKAVVDALAEKSVIDRSDITSRIRRHEQHVPDAAPSDDLTHELQELRKLLE